MVTRGSSEGSTPPVPLVVVLMGLTSSGKSTAGQALARAWGWPYVDGDDFHAPASIEKMRAGIPLTDADRLPWLEALHAKAQQTLDDGGGVILGCSALKQSHRDILQGYLTRVVFVWLDVPVAELTERIAARQDHFMPPSLLDSQLSTLEPPHDAVRVDAHAPVDEVVRRITDGVSAWVREDAPPPPV